MASNGFTLYGATTMLAALLSGTVYGKLHIGDPMDGTMNPSVYTTRQAMTFAAPDSNGMRDLSTPVSFGVLTATEQIWGVSLWTAVTAGNCFLIHQFSQAKNVFSGDTLKLASIPIKFPIVGQ